MGRQEGGHTGPHAYPADKMIAKIAMKVNDTPGSRKAAKKNHNRKSRQWVRKQIAKWRDD